MIAVLYTYKWLLTALDSGTVLMDLRRYGCCMGAVRLDYPLRRRVLILA